MVARSLTSQGFQVVAAKEGRGAPRTAAPAASAAGVLSIRKVLRIVHVSSDTCTCIIVHGSGSLHTTVLFDRGLERILWRITLESAHRFKIPNMSDDDDFMQDSDQEE